MTWALAGGGKAEGLRVGLRSEYEKKLSPASDARGVGGYEEYIDVKSSGVGRHKNVVEFP